MTMSYAIGRRGSQRVLQDIRLTCAPWPLLAAVCLVIALVLPTDIAAAQTPDHHPPSATVPEHRRQTANQHLADGEVNSENPQAQRELHWACATGNLETAERLIAAGADINAKDKFGHTPLHRACHNGHVELVEFLAKAGADVNARDSEGMTPIMATPSPKWQVLSSWIPSDEKWLKEKTVAGIVPILIRYGAELQAEDRQGRTALHWIAQRGDADAVRALISAKANVNARNSWGATPLHWATGRLAIEALVIAGADVNARDKRGKTPLHGAADRAAVESLVTAGPDVNARDVDGETPLHVSTERLQHEVMRALLTAGADVNARNDRGRTPLMQAACFMGADLDRLRQAIDILVGAGADLNASDNRNQTVVECAKHHGHRAIASILKSYAWDIATNGKPSVPNVKTSEQCRKLVAKAVNPFGLKMYLDLRHDRNNLVFSPLSVFLPMAIASEGARGLTRDEMVGALHLSDVEKPVLKKLGELESALNRSVHQEGVQLHIGNALWVNKSPDWRINSELREAMRANVGITVREADFKAGPSKVAKEINEWVAESTRGNITDLVTADQMVSHQCALAILNAVYFKSRWAAPFKAKKTRHEDFTLLDGSLLRTPMMRGHSNEYRYAKAPDFEVLEMPYEDRDLSMVIMLPARADGLTDLEESLTLEMLTERLGQLTPWPRGVIAWIPSFKARSRVELNSSLKLTGMKRAFVSPGTPGGADFSGLAEPNLADEPRRLPFLGTVLQEVLIAVNEEGTAAAAATAALFEISIAEGHDPIVFRADHPFMFLIRHKPSGCILFMGRVTDPSKMN